MATQELNTVLRRNASNAQTRQAIASASRSLNRRIPNKTKEKLIAPTAGFISAAMEITAVWPFEYAKTQLQLNRTNPNFNIVQHMKGEGLGIYKGLAPLLIGAPIQGLLRFSSLDYFNQRLKDPVTGKVSVAAGLGAGLAAGILESCIVVAPMETIKTRLIHANMSLSDGVAYVIKKEGVRGLYKGLGATIAKSASNQGARFVIFNQYKNMLTTSPDQKLTAGQSLVGGMVAGVLGAFFNTPVDVVKSRMQGLEASQYKNMFDCAQQMVRNEGFGSLYKGLIPRCGRVVPGQGIIFCAYSTISDSMRATLLEE